MSARRGPAVLGRGAVVATGQPAPDGLGDAPRVVVDAAVLDQPGSTVDRLHRLWMARTPVVVELRVDPADLQGAETSTDPVWAHDAAFLFGRDRLRHLVWANGVDHRTGRPVWWHAVKAVRAIPGLRAGGPADVLLPDGTPAWIDGGPRQPLDLTARVLHRDDTERGVLAAPPAPSAHAAVGLASDQAAAVAEPRGAVRVAAPAGSGKTRVLAARLGEVLGSRGTPPDSVLALAYNTAAAAELRQRSPVAGTRASTVHAYALGLLRRHVGPIDVLGERDVRELLHPLVAPPRKANVDPLQPYLDALDRVRVALVDPATVQAERDDVEDLPQVLDRLRRAMAARGAVDFPEMVYRAIEVLLTDPRARAAEQARVGEVLVDEFQDLTPAYLLFIRLLASPQLQCFGVGDDDQVIYGHAGATPTYLLRFDDLFPGAIDHPLTVNYRCPGPVVEAAATLLAHNAVRLDKTIVPAATAGPSAVHVDRVDRAAEATTAADLVTGLLASGIPAADIAVLARIRVALLGTQAVLATREVPTRSPIGPWLLDRTSVRAALSYLRLATGERMAGDDLAEILHRPLRRIPATFREVLRGRRWTTDELSAAAERAERAGTGRALQDLVRDLAVLRRRAASQPTAEVLRHITDVVGLGDVAQSLDSSAAGPGAPQGSVMAASHIDDLAALQQVADHCPDPSAFEAFLHDVVAQPAPSGPAVTLSTIHSVKGLEWPHVIVVGAAEGVLPHRLATGAAEVEEERRVFHVAITRARDRLAVVAPKTGTSRFVAEMLGQPTMLAPTAAPRATAGTPPRRPQAARRAPGRRRGGDRTAPTRFRATVGLEVRAAGGLAGRVESLGDDGALVRTDRGSLLRLRYGDEVRVDGTFGTLTRP